jgi:acyl-CoA thioesterase
VLDDFQRLRVGHLIKIVWLAYLSDLTVCSVSSQFSAVRNLFVPSRSQRCAFAIQLHRLNAMAEWKFAAAVLARIYQLKTNADLEKLP